MTTFPDFGGQTEIMTMRAALNFIIGYVGDEPDERQQYIAKIAKAGLDAADSRPRKIAKRNRLRIEDLTVADVVEFPNSATPEQRQECGLAIGALEVLAEKWAADVDLPGIAKNLAHVSRLAPHAPDKVREEFITRQETQIAAMIEQAWIEGALHGSTGAFDLVRSGYDPVTKTMSGVAKNPD